MAPPSGHPTLCAQVWSACVCVHSSTVQNGSLGQDRLGRTMACGRAEPGPLGPSRRRWLGSARFPGSGFPLTPPGCRGLPPPHPHPAPGMFLSTPALLPRGRPLGAATAPPPLPGRGQSGQDAWVPAPSHPREKFLRGPLRLWVPKITLRGKGGCGGRKAGGAPRRAAGCCRCLWEEGSRRRGSTGGWGTN